MSNVVKSNKISKVAKVNLSRKIVNTKIRGLELDTSRFRWHKISTPATNGVQKIFTIPDNEEYVSGLLEVFLDGLLQVKNTDYTETTSTTFTMTNAPDSDETLIINYIKK
jgi:hypothetical protein